MLEIIKQFVRRMLMGKGKGILKIPPQKAVDDFAKDLLKKFKKNGIPDEAIKLWSGDYSEDITDVIMDRFRED